MISPAERAYISEYAYVPEHLPEYVSAISGTEPFLIGDFILHLRANHLIFVGYPLRESWIDAQVIAAIDQVKASFKTAFISIIAPSLPSGLDGFSPSHPDEYYRLDLPQRSIPKKTRNMLKRAQREVSICIGKFGREHNKLIKSYLRDSRLDKATRSIFKRVPKYIKSKSVQVFDARNAQGELVAFDVADFGARHYAFYMFNFRSNKHHVPGASDLLLAHIIERAQIENKRYFNLGLGIHPGIAFFKKKWGAAPFLKHIAWVQKTTDMVPWWKALDQLAR
jgi:hypothetical protein